MASRRSPRNPPDRRRPEPVGRDLYEAANYAACTLYDQLADRLPSRKRLGDAGSERASKIGKYAAYVSIGDLMRLADAGLRDEVVALLSAQIDEINKAPTLDEEASLAESSREVGEALAVGIEGARDPSLRPRVIKEWMDVGRTAMRIVRGQMRRHLEDSQLDAITQGRVAGLRATRPQGPGQAA